MKKGREKVAEQVAQEYFPIIEKTMKKPSIPYCDELLKAMSYLADKGQVQIQGMEYRSGIHLLYGLSVGKRKAEMGEAFL